MGFVCSVISPQAQSDGAESVPYSRFQFSAHAFAPLRHFAAPAATEDAGVAAEGPDMEKRCQFWLPNKRRYCANGPLPSSRFCGNHDPDAGARRVPCPIDPSHYVSEDNLESHLKRCPFRKRAEALESQPYYSKDINTGCPGAEVCNVDSAAKRNAVLGLSISKFWELVNKIKSVHSSLPVVLRESYVVSEACEKWVEEQVGSGKLPYQEKHATQQASIIGNMEAFGILPPAVSISEDGEHIKQNDFDFKEDGAPAVVEFGAGRGYLTHMLADCYGISKIFLIERRSYKLKADRTLRQSRSITLERLRIDIEDLNLTEVNLLKGLPYLAIGKHLCGPATDLTLRCCLGDGSSQPKEKIAANHHLQGLALATCCHHLCQWKTYTNQDLMLRLGLTKEDFHAITWFTSWAVDDDYSSDLLSTSHTVLSISEENDTTSTNKGVEETIRSIPAVERALFGFLCKEIIDVGRLLWLSDRGMDAQLIKYVPSKVSPENHLLLAKI